MANAIIFHEAINKIGQNLLDLDGDTFKAVLTNTAPAQATDDERADLTEITEEFGYAALTLTGVAWAETGAGTGIWEWTVDDFEWTAIGGTFGPFRYVVIFDEDQVGDPLLCYADIGVALSITDGNKFTADVGANGVFRIGAGAIS